MIWCCHGVVGDGLHPQQAGELPVLAEQFDCVTIFYGEIIGFTALISDCSASEV